MLGNGNSAKLTVTASTPGSTATAIKESLRTVSNTVRGSKDSQTATSIKVSMHSASLQGSGNTIGPTAATSRAHLRVV